MVTKSCKGITCISPWSVIHPAGNVRTLQDALDAKFDGFYEALAEEVVRFDRCELGYIVESEGPQKLTTFEEWKNEEIWRGEL
jgi:N-acetylglucosamine-6-sulfatase